MKKEIVVCDKCGQRVDETEYKMMSAVSSKGGSKATSIDLCCDCFKAFIKWTNSIEEGAKSEEPKKEGKSEKTETTKELGSAYSEEQKAAFNKMFVAGESNRSMMLQLGLNYNQVVYLGVEARKNGLKRGTPKQRLERKEEHENSPVKIDTRDYLVVI